jgi:predicted metalloprotease
MNAAAQIGDDTLQREAGAGGAARQLHARHERAAAALVPGGLESGELAACDTFRTNDPLTPPGPR